jgi:hypothetical protein
MLSSGDLGATARLSLLTSTTAMGLALAVTPARVQSTALRVQLPAVSVEGERPPSDPAVDYQTRQPSSPKYTQPMIDAPQTISVIPQAVIQDRAATTLRDVHRRCPAAPDLPAVVQPLCRWPDVRHACGQCRARRARPPHKVRTDLLLTLFLSDPADSDGGELTVEDTWGLHRIKLPAGDLIL